MTSSRRLPCGVALVVIALLARGTPAPAQDAVIHGRVIDDRGDALPASTIQIPELSIGVCTNNAGAYTILIPAARVSGQSVTLRVRVHRSAGGH